MFGTLVVALPSKHVGGAVVAKHDGETKMLETDKNSEFDYSFLTWYVYSQHAEPRVSSACSTAAGVTADFFFFLESGMQT
jgi:hypothetical protein